MPQRLNSFLASNQELRQISGKVKQLRAMQLHYSQIAPPSLLRASHVIQLENNVLTLAANNSAIAAKLRQMTPELVRQIQLRDCEVTGIQVRVQVTAPPNTRLATHVSLSPQGTQQLNDFAKTLDDSPLKTALQRLTSIKRDKK